MNDKNKLLDKKQYSDVRLVAQMIGVTPENAHKILRRPNSKRHQEAIDALSKIIESREQLIESKS